MTKSTIGGMVLFGVCISVGITSVIVGTPKSAEQIAQDQKEASDKAAREAAIEASHRARDACRKYNQEADQPIIACGNISDKCLQYGTCDQIYQSFKCAQIYRREWSAPAQCTEAMRIGVAALRQIEEADRAEIKNYYTIQ